MEFRFNHYGTYLRKTFGGRVYKIMVDGGFTCPNRDGKVGYGGCIYCNNDAFTVGIVGEGEPVRLQVDKALALKKRRKKYRNARFLVYFQKYTNTYAPPHVLKERYESALVSEDIAGIVVGTRPDCVDPGVIDTLRTLKEKTHVSVELGVQTISDEVLAKINRGHSFADFTYAARLLLEAGIPFGVHMIYGLPGDTRENFVESAGVIANAGATLVKLNHVHVVRNTPLEKIWREGMFKPPSFEKYLEVVCDFLERLPPHVTVARLISTTPERYLLAPRWNVGSARFINMVNEKLSNRGTFQGKSWQGEESGRGTRGLSLTNETIEENRASNLSTPHNNSTNGGGDA